jgi:hypothetical protein
MVCLRASERQRSEQYLTSSQTLAHLRRQVNGRLQKAQGFCGRSDFLLCFGMQRIWSGAD